MLSRPSGFTLMELLVSIGILTMISLTTVLSLRTTQSKGELNTAARLLVSDIRNVQARALAARNILTCEVAPGIKRVCETSNTSPTACLGACLPFPPAHVGISFTATEDTYTLFADTMTEDWHYNGVNELLQARNLNPLGGAKVKIFEIKTNLGTLTTASVAVGRQNGTMRIEACGDVGLPVCSPTEPKFLDITLQHVKSGDTVTVEVNALTGRVSML